MKNIYSVLLIFVIVLKQFDAVEHEFEARLNMLDKHMRRLNLTDIHFSNPSDIVKVDTVINVYEPETAEDIIKRMQKKLNKTANYMVNSNPQQMAEWKKNAINVPLPRPRG